MIARFLLKNKLLIEKKEIVDKQKLVKIMLPLLLDLE